MPENELVVSDTSPLLNLAFIDQLELLKSQFGNVKVPRKVWEEIKEGEKGREALEKRKDEFIEIVEITEKGLFTELRQRLDKGESAAITYAIEEQADLILLDEKEGRKTARNHGLETTGVIGILLKASENDRINLKEEMKNLREEGFWISEELYKRLI